MELTFCDSLTFGLRFCALVVGEIEALGVSLIGETEALGLSDRWDWRFVTHWLGGTKTLWPATCGTEVLRFSERWAWGLVIQRPVGLSFSASATGVTEV